MKRTLLYLGLVTVLPCLAAAEINPYDQSGVPLEVQPTDPGLTKIVIVAGRQSHGPGDHEFFAGSAILMNMLKQTPGVFPVMARDGWPKDPEKTFAGAKAVVFYMDGGGGHPIIQKEHKEVLAKLMEKKVGFVNLHYAVEYPKLQSEHDPQLARRLLRNRLLDQSALGRQLQEDAGASDHARRQAVRDQGRVVLQHPFPAGVRGRDADPDGDTTGKRAQQRRSRRSSPAVKRSWPGRSSVPTAAAVSASPAATRTRTGARRTSAAWWSMRSCGARNVEVPKDGAKVVMDPAELNKNLDDKRAKK